MTLSMSVDKTVNKVCSKHPAPFETEQVIENKLPKLLILLEPHTKWQSEAMLWLSKYFVRQKNPRIAFL